MCSPEIEVENVEVFTVYAFVHMVAFSHRSVISGFLRHPSEITSRTVRNSSGISGGFRQLRKYMMVICRGGAERSRIYGGPKGTSLFFYNSLYFPCVLQLFKETF